MSKPFLKKKSKRVSTKTRCKVEKKVREHQRKVRRQLKKTNKKGRKNKELVVPSKAPFKEAILEEARKQKAEKEESKIKKKEKLKMLREAVKKQLKNKSRNADSINKLVEQARENVKKHIEKEKKHCVSEVYNMATPSDGSLKAYYSEVKQVLSKADVIIEVLDARDPLGSRCAQLESAVLSANKRLVLLLNKIDLIPKENVTKWIEYLRRELPTIAFKASTQEQTTNLGTGARDASSTSKCVGSELLMKLLANYCRNKDIKTRIVVGVIGFPNVGKSSVINSLKRSRSCNVGATPGITKSVQEVELDKKIRLLDSPGVVMAKKENGDYSEIALKNAVRIETLMDPLTPVEAVLRKVSHDSLMLQYNLPEFSDTVEFLALLAQRLGKVKKGGVPDSTAAARHVLHDWNAGKIRYYTEPPELAPPNSSFNEFAIVEEMGKEFSIDEVDDTQKLMIENLPEVPKSLCVPIVSSGTSDGLVTAPESMFEPDKLDSGSSSSQVKVVHVMKQKNKLEDDTNMDSEMILPGNQSFNKQKRIALKRLNKKKKRTEKIATKLSDSLNKALDTFMDTGNNYDFSDSIA